MGMYGLNEIELRLFQAKYRELLRAAKHLMDAKDRKKIRYALDFAAEAHKGMRRRTGEPFIFHPLEVAIIVAKEIGLGTTSIISALLHDVVEDTDRTIEEIESIFGKKVAIIVEGLTKIASLVDHQELSTTQQIETYKKILLTLSEDIRVVLIKLADRLHNMRTLDAMPLEKQIKICGETSNIYAPLAHRLGLYNIKSELEDLVLKYTDPEVYQSIGKKLQETEEARSQFIRDFIKPIEEKLKQTLPYPFEIYGRTKSIASIWNKMNKKGVPFEEVYDIFAIRIIINAPPADEVAACWLAYSVVTKIYTPNPERLRDWISVPKPNGYEALHITVMSHTGKWVEVQIRSTRMNEVAERGYAAHWKYKENQNDENSLDHWLVKINELLKKPESNALDFLDEFQITLASEEIYVFTPKGELKTLPKGSTVIDFAYAIHTDVGHRCIGAKVNHHLVPLNFQLKNGDQVEILTSDNQHPREEWLLWVVTPKARSLIKQYLKDVKRAQMEQGKAKLEKIFAEIGLPFNEGQLLKLSRYLGYENDYQKVYLDTFNGKIDSKTLRGFASAYGRNKWLKYIRMPFLKRTSASKQKKDETIDLDTTAEISYVISPCCHPIPGDPIVGCVTAQNKLEIHRSNCPQALKFSSQFGDRIKKVKWQKSNSIEFKTFIAVEGIDRIGILRDISRIISEENNLNIRALNIEATEGKFSGIISLYVHDTKHLQQLIDELSKIEGMISVRRMSSL
ncbi:MAG: RelA/SpoT family protein [Bacteroidales bacterium]|nr:RelA/SpoT family protein [Bacteroidales bacterium]